MKSARISRLAGAVSLVAILLGTSVVSAQANEITAPVGAEFYTQNEEAQKLLEPSFYDVPDSLR